MKTYHSNKKYDKYYIYFYWGALNEFDLSLSEGLLISLIATLSHKFGYCYASKKFLAKRLRLSQPTIFKCQKNLFEKELIKKVGISEYGVIYLSPTEKFNSYIKNFKGVDIYNE